MSLDPRPNRIELQPRDYALLQSLLDSRLLTLKHAAVLHFAGKPEAAKKRMQKLRSAGMVVPRARRPQEPAIYMLGREGYEQLKQAGLMGPVDPGWRKLQKRQRIGDLMLRHELAVLDVKTAFITAIGQVPRLELAEISTSPNKHQFRVVEAVPARGGGVRFKSLYAKPDGFLHLREQREDGSLLERYFFLEVDQGTEALGRLLQKARHYSQYYRKGGFAMKRGGARQDFKRFPFRVLMAFRSAQRCRNVARMLHQADASMRRQVWLTTLSELLDNPMGPIWTTPFSCQVVETGTPPGRDEAKTIAGTRRRPHLELTADTRAETMKLFETGS